MSIDEALKQLLFVERKGSAIIREVTSDNFFVVESHSYWTILLHKFESVKQQRPLFQDKLDKAAAERNKTFLNFNEARDDGMAMASAGPYANHLYLASDG